jgi:N,N-dimethylformamidase
VKITGYADHLSVAAGRSLTFRVSSEATSYRARLVRLIHGDRNPLGPGFKHEVCASNIEGEYPGRPQPIHIGSYARIPDHPVLRVVTDFAFTCWLWPTARRERLQVLLSRGENQLSLYLDAAGHLGVSVRGAPCVRTQAPLRLREWCFVSLRFSAEDRNMTLGCTPASYWPDARAECVTATLPVSNPWPHQGDLLFAAEDCAAAGVGNHYNGKLESPRLFSRALRNDELAAIENSAAHAFLPGCAAAWNFSLESRGAQILDSSANSLHGQLFNLPARAMTGHGWTGEEDNFRRAPGHYGAIHFHEDDLDDARWEASFTLDVPELTRSGIYAVHLSSELGEDFVPFVITPGGSGPRARVVFLVPTMTYLAYGNEAIANRPDIKDMMRVAGITGAAPYPSQQEDKFIVAHRLLSCYDIHSDGSGVCYSTKRRPLLNMRPYYLMPLHGLAVRPGGAAHLLTADLYITDWLESQGIAFDVVTDDELDAQGAALLSPYQTVITGSHPEYFTQTMFDAVEAYCRDGGRLMYLGGNGFFIVTSLTPERHAIETRRSRTARAWTSQPGEEFHNTSGELGGPWKYRARPAQRLVGVGTTAVGYTSGRGYQRTEASRGTHVSWIFANVKEECIGAFPNLIYGDGAAAWEIDRADHALGTPGHAVVLATARIDDDSYQQIVDELEAAGGHTGGSVNPNVRADLVYLDYPNGGAVFSVGSCFWAGALSYNGYDNNVSRVTGNVLRRFMGSDETP